MMKNIWLLLLVALPVEAAELTMEQWAVPRSGEVVRQMPAVVDTMRAFMAGPESTRIIIRYPGGDEGTIWAGELQAWLVALGVDSSRIESRPGSPAEDVIELGVEQ